MKTVYTGPKQNGIALILSLLILVTMTIIGVSALSGTNMQERMAGNTYLQAQAFEAASAGVAQSLEFKEDYFPAGKSCNASTTNEWFADWEDSGSIGDATLMQRMYCLPFKVDDSGPVAGYELFVLNRGVVSVDNQTVAEREVEVRIGRFGNDEPRCNSSAMCFPLQPDITLDPDCGDASASDFCTCNFGKGGSSTNPFNGFNSNAFSVIGQELGEIGHGPAMSLSPNLKKAFECEVTGGSTDEQCDSSGGTNKCSRLGNYLGGTAGSEEFGSPWDDPQLTFDFVSELYFERSEDFITYVEGDHSMGGSDSGNGIIVVEGDLEWNGTPNFDGLIIVLGGSFNVKGSGQGGDGAGSVVVLDLEPKPSDQSEDSQGVPTFGGDFSMEFAGGGTASYSFGCTELWDAWRDLGPASGADDSGNFSPAQGLWQPQCNEDGSAPVDATDGIVSWRENIGWRSEDFAGSQD